jgi:hypothetical protein
MDYKGLQGVMCKTAASSSTSIHGRQGASVGLGGRRRPRRPGARVRRGKRRGDRGEHVGLLTLVADGREEGRRWRVAAAGGGCKRRRRFGGQLATENGGMGSSRQEDARGVARLSGRSTEAPYFEEGRRRCWWPAVTRAGGGAGGGGKAGARARVRLIRGRVCWWPGWRVGANGLERVSGWAGG